METTKIEADDKVIWKDRECVVIANDKGGLVLRNPATGSKIVNVKVADVTPAKK